MAQSIAYEMCKDGIAGAAGLGAGYLGTELGSQAFGPSAGKWIGLATGLAAGFGAAGGIDALNQNHNWSGLARGLPGGPAPGVPNKPTSTFYDDEMIVSNSKFLNMDGDIDWEKYAPNSGYLEGTKTGGYTLKPNTTIDRYGNNYGRYTSPVGTTYEQRSLPYVENPNAYHQYRVVQSIDNVSTGTIAPGFEQVGGGIQFELPSSINQLIRDGFLEEIVR